MISNDGTKALLKAIEHDMYYGADTARAQHKLTNFLAKLGVKSARANNLMFGAPLQFESLQGVLKQVTFESDKLKLWKDIK